MADPTGISIPMGTVADWAVATAIFATVIVVLFGDRLKARLFRPQISIRLLTEKGELCPVVIQQSPGEIPQRAKGHSYHVAVKGLNRYIS